MERAMFSDMLAERRRQLGYSIREASRVLRLREDIIIAFEEGDFERMPKSGYAQGMLSSYARYLGLDASMVVEAYVEDFERYKREGRRRGVNRDAMTRNGVDSTSHVQPYVPSRGLLPTSGGPAGDMGSFATTRVRTRGSSTSDESMEFSADYTQVRPYTELAPPKNSMRSRRVYSDDYHSDRSSTRTRSRGSRSRRGSSRIDTDSARGGTGSMSRRGSGASSSGRRKGRGGRRGSRQSSRPSLTAGIPSVVFVVVGGLLVIGLALFLVLGVGSCVRREPTSSHTIPVTSADETSNDQATQGDASTNASTNGAGTTNSTTTSVDVTETDANTTTSGSSSSTTQEKETSVSVSVAADAVTWLEIDCDGVSEVAETVTGPWQHTYTVEESISIQAGDTTAVSVVRDGSQVQFESMASGIGTIRIQGTPSSKSKSKTTTDASSKNTSSKQDTSTKSSDSSSVVDEEDEGLDDSYSDDSSYEDDYAYDYEDDSTYEDDSSYEDGYEDEQY